MKKFFGTENEYQNFNVEKKIFFNEFFCFLQGKIFFFLQAFINEAHQKKLAFQDKKNFFCFAVFENFSYKMKLFFNKKLKAFVRLFLEKITWLDIPARGVKSLEKIKHLPTPNFSF